MKIRPSKRYTGLLVMILAAWSMLQLPGCGARKPYAIGNLDQIIVFADSLDWVEYKDGLESHFGKIYRMPLDEKEYLLEWRPAHKFDEFATHKNIMFLSRLDSRATISARVNRLLSDEVKAGINSGDFFYIPQYDTYALDQYVVFLVAPDKDGMIQRLYDEGELVYDNFRESYYKRLEELLFLRYEKTQLSEYIETYFPFTLRIQADFDLLDESVENRYIWLRRFRPDRNLAVYWEPLTDSTKINMEWMIKARNALGKRIWEGDEVVVEETSAERVQFARRPALRMEGTWRNPTHWVGGPFRSTAFVDREQGLVFLVDISVHAVNQRKKPYLDQLDVMAHTFQTKTAAKAEVASD